MCGIAGIFTQRRIDPALVDAMTDRLAHRGPDNRGTWIDQAENIALGFRRLAILDLTAAGNQPMQSASRRFTLVYNGEIYNHLDLRRAIEADGAVGWRGHSDTETLLAAIERWGLEQTLERSVGMFALALWDGQEKTLTLARDRIGEKPLYYGWSGRSFLFASELKAITARPDFEGMIDRRALDLFVRRAYIPAPLSIYRDIFKLEPGTTLRLDRRATNGRPAGFAGTPIDLPSIAINRYWSAGTAVAEGIRDPVGSRKEAVDGLERCLIEAVRGQSIADVPLGTFLSGGIDSSTIAAIQRHHTDSRVETFTIGFEEARFDEAPFARAVAKHLGIVCHEARVTAADALNVIPMLPDIYDEPFADSSQIPTFLLSKMARLKVTVALSGDGGDELFGGYGRYSTIPRLRGRVTHVPATIRRALARTIRAAGSRRIDRIGAVTGLSRRFPQFGPKALKFARILADGDDLGSLHSAMMSQWEGYSNVVLGVIPDDRWPNEDPVGAGSDVRTLMNWDLEGYLPDDILCKVDRASMAASLETRAPYLDHRLVEFAARIPSAMTTDERGSKAVLRQLLYRYVPGDLVDRPKAGFSIPLGQWLRGPLRDWAEQLVDQDRLESEGYFDAGVIRDRWHTHLAGRRDYSTALWPILVFQSWNERRLRSPLGHNDSISQSATKSRQASRPSESIG